MFETSWEPCFPQAPPVPPDTRFPTDEDLDPGFWYYESGCITRAAQNPNSRILRFLLAYGFEEWNSRNPRRSIKEDERVRYFDPNAAQNV